MRPRFLLTAVILCAGAGIASANMIFDNFEGYHSQAEFQATWRPWSSDGSSMSLATIGGSAAVHGVAATNYLNRNARNLNSFTEYVGTDAKPVKFEFSIYEIDPQSGAAGSARNFNEIRAYAGDGVPAYGGAGLQGLVAMGLYNTPVSSANYHARVYYGGQNSWYNLNTPRMAGWHKLTALIGSTNIKFLVDDVLDTTVPLPTLSKVYTFDGVILGSGLTSGGYDTAFDSVLVTAPEPLPLVLLAAGAIFLRRRPGRVAR